MAFIIGAQLTPQGRSDLLDVIGTDVGTQPLEFLTQLWTDQIGTRRQDLAQLDKRGAQIGQGHPHSLLASVL